MIKHFASFLTLVLFFHASWGKVIEERSITNGYHSNFVWMLKKHLVSSKPGYSLQRMGPTTQIRAIQLPQEEYQKLIKLYDSTELARFSESSNRAPTRKNEINCLHPVLGFSIVENSRPKTAFACLEKLPSENRQQLTRLLKMMSKSFN